MGEIRIIKIQGVRSGKPCVRGTRITVVDVLEWFAGGNSEKDLIDNFPSLSKEDVRACINYAAQQIAAPWRRE